MKANNKPIWLQLGSSPDAASKRACASKSKLLRLALSLLILLQSLPALAAQDQRLRPQVISYRPLTLKLPSEQVLSELNQELLKLLQEEFVENKVRFRFSEPHAIIEGQGVIQIRTRIQAQTSVPIIGKIKADARGKLWLHVNIDDWRSQVLATDSDIRFSNDVINLAFQPLRSRLEKQIVDMARKSLDSMNRLIDPGSSEILATIQSQGRLDGVLEADGFWIRLTARHD